MVAGYGFSAALGVIAAVVVGCAVARKCDMRSPCLTVKNKVIFFLNNKDNDELSSKSLEKS